MCGAGRAAIAWGRRRSCSNTKDHCRQHRRARIVLNPFNIERQHLSVNALRWKPIRLPLPGETLHFRTGPQAKALKELRDAE